ncbi:hypothetical protein ACJMK2_003735 [Sinanodonta woodiana]|uniref:Uncharacterized protein n=1 Tax=Sinanodonta woodiana TaxID=1069815 RepID=A0ABD3Y2E9_SINWO
MDPRCVAIRACIKSLRLALVTGIKGQTNEHWESFQDEQTSVANTALKFDLNYESDGAMNIAICYDATDETHDKDPGVHYEDLQEYSKDPGVHYDDLQEYSKDPGVQYDDLQEYSKDPHVHNDELKIHHREPQAYYNDIQSNLYIDPFDFLQTTKSERNNEVHQSDCPSHLYADPFEFLKTNPHPQKEITERDTKKEITERDTINPSTTIPLSIHHVLSPSISERHQRTTVKSLTSSQRLVSTSTKGITPENSNTSLLNDTEQLTKM